jgi:uncharacterized protein (TIGR02145 family)
MRHFFNFSCGLLLLSSLGACSSREEAKQKQNKPVSTRVVEPNQDYDTCQIGQQVWMAQNLNEPHFRNGDLIKQAKTLDEWKKAGNTCTPAWCYYNNDSALGEKFGKLYNWYAVNDPRGLAPKGWGLPANADFQQLLRTLGKLDKDAMALQHPTFVGDYPDSDVLRFHAYGSGYRKEAGAFSGKDEYASYWSKDTANTYSANALYLNKNKFDPLWGSYYKSGGFSVRCLRK